MDDEILALVLTEVLQKFLIFKVVLVDFEVDPVGSCEDVENLACAEQFEVMVASYQHCDSFLEQDWPKLIILVV